MPISTPNRIRAARFLLALAILVPAASAAERRVHKVSGASVPNSDVTWVAAANTTHISPDGEWIVWIQDAEVNDAHALWAARRWGGAPKRLSGTLAPGAEFEVVRFSPDSRHVLYVAEQETADRMELYTVPLLGTAADGVKLNPPIPGDEDVAGFILKFSADGARIVFNTTALGTNGHTLFSAPVDGSSPAVGLDGPFDDDGRTYNFVVAPGRVVFQRRASSTAPFEIWTVPITGGTKTRLTPPLPDSDGARAPRLAPGNARVVFLLENDAAQPADELWSAAVAGAEGSAVRLADVPAPGGKVDFWQFSPDGSRVVLAGDREIDGKTEVYSVPTNGTAPPVKLNTGLIANGDVDSFGISPDGTTVVYLADWAVDERKETFSVPILGPSAASVRLNRPLAAGESTHPGLYFDDRILYVVGDAAGTYANELRGAPYGGPASAEWPILLAETLISAPGVILPERSVVRADLAAPGEFELWTVKNDGTGAPENLFNPIWTDPVLGGASATTPDSVEFFFLASIDGGPLHLWATRVDGLQPLPRRLSLVPVAGGGVIDDQTALETTPDGQGVLYEADAEVDTRVELYISDSLLFAADFDEEGDLSEWTD